MPKPLPPHALQNVTWTTPTGYAEAGYQADKLRHNKPMPIGPAGLPIPSTMAIYRPTIDKTLLPNLCRAAYRAHCAAELPEASERAAEAAVRRELAMRFPPADMAVLARYRLTVEATHWPLFLLTPRASITHRIELDPSVTIPSMTAFGFYVDLGGQQRTGVPPAPADLEIYGRTAAQVRDAKALFDRPLGWASQFKVRNGRWPKWIEIEREFPPLGGWLAEQRAGIAAASSPKDPTA